MSFLKKIFQRKKEVQTNTVEVVSEELKNHETTPSQTKQQSKEDTNEEEAREAASEEDTPEEALEAASEEDTPEEALEAASEEDASEEAREAASEEDTPEEALEATSKEETVEEVLEAIREEETVEEVQETTREEETVEEVLEATREEEAVEEVPKKKGFFGKLVDGLAKTRNQLLGTVDDVLKRFKVIDEELYEELEEVLIMADFGVNTTLFIMDELRKTVKEEKLTDPEALKEALKKIIAGILSDQEATPIIDPTRKNVVLVIGVNGVGKTTTIGKLSHQLKQQGHKVVLAAADTFRAAAIDQLEIWASRADVEIVKHNEGTDPAAVVYDGIQAAKARKADVLICDTAGRLQNKTNLMKELEKIGRVIEREYPEAHKEVLIVLDATTGQNAISQVKVFKEAVKVDGIVLTKLDGTAKGGAIVGICESMKVPVKYIGVGEKIEDLQVFDSKAFAEALFSKNEK